MATRDLWAVKTRGELHQLGGRLLRRIRSFESLSGAVRRLHDKVEASGRKMRKRKFESSKKALVTKQHVLESNQTTYVSQTKNKSNQINLQHQTKELFAYLKKLITFQKVFTCLF